MNTNTKEFIDLSHILDNGIPVYPGDEALSLAQTNFYETDKYNSFSLKTSMHVGTHIDGFMHMTGSTEFISALKPGRFAGTAKVIDCRGEKIICLSEEIEKSVCKGDNVLFCTGFASHWGTEKYFSGHPVIDAALAEFLIHKKINIAGFDTPSPDRLPFTLHKRLLENDILILENLTNLSELLKYKEVTLYAFPLKIMADSSLVRAVAEVK